MKPDARVYWYSLATKEIKSLLLSQSGMCRRNSGEKPIEEIDEAEAQTYLDMWNKNTIFSGLHYAFSPEDLEDGFTPKLFGEI